MLREKKMKKCCFLPWNASSRWAGFTWPRICIRFSFISFSFACFGSLAPPGRMLACYLHTEAYLVEGIG